VRDGRILGVGTVDELKEWGTATGAMITIIALAGHPDQFNPEAWGSIEQAGDRC
jgi:hypothetical protein